MPYAIQVLPYLVASRPRTVRLLVWAFYVVLFVALVNPVAAATWNELNIGPDLKVSGINAGNLGLAEAVAFGPARPPSVQEVLLKVCQERGYDESCAKSLLGMAWKESLFDPSAIGDRGKAVGFFQIHIKRHRVTRSCAQDLRCSARWTLTYMESNGYPKYARYAIQCHNGCKVANGYAASVERNGKRLWRETTPVTVQTEAKVVALKK